MSVEDYTTQAAGRISYGGYGIVDRGSDAHGHQVAIKKELTSDKVTRSPLAHEYAVYQALGPHPALPTTYAYGRQGQFNVLVMELLGQAVGDFLRRNGKSPFSLKTVVLLGIGMLDAISFVHSKGIIHCDVSQGNFLLGQPGPHYRTVHLVDFGLARRYRDPSTGQHAPFHDDAASAGTAMYCSLGSHLRQAQSRRDDLQSLCYVLLRLARGSLPWGNIKGGTEKHRALRIQEKKRSWTAERLCTGHESLEPFVKYCFSLAWDQDPDYAYLRNELTQIVKLHDWSLDDPYDWDEPDWNPSKPAQKTLVSHNVDPSKLPVKAGDLILLRMSPQRSLEYDDLVSGPNTPDPSYYPHPPLPGGETKWKFPYRPAIVCDIISGGDSRLFRVRAYPLMKRKDGLDHVAPERRHTFRQLSGIPFDGLYAYKLPAGTPVLAIPHGCYDGNEIVLSLPDAYTKQLGDELQQAGIQWKTTYASDDATTRAVYDSLPSTYMHILRPVVDIQPLRPEHILEDTGEVDWEGITGWMEEFFAVEEIRRQEDGEANSEEESDDELRDYWEWPRPEDRRLSCTLSFDSLLGRADELTVVQSADGSAADSLP